MSNTERDIWVVFDGPPGPESGRFIETEDESGKGVGGGFGWNQYEKYWKLGPFADRAEVVKLEVKFAEAEDENQRLREALGWYAEEKNYNPRGGMTAPKAKTTYDRGRQARAALAAYDVAKKGGE